MTRLSALAVDPAKAVDGVWVAWVRGVRLRVARLGNRQHREFLTAEFQRLRAELGRQPNEQESHTIEIRALAYGVLRDWEGVTDDNDAPIVYTPEVGASVLANDDYEELRDFVVQRSTQMEAFTRAQAREIEGK